MAAALLMANLQANLRSRSATASAQPEQFLKSLNQAFYENTADRDYATLFFAEYDDRARRLRYSNCGHPPPFLVRANGSLERLEPTSTVLGIFEQWNCSIQERRLEPGDTLVLFTDGATEASNEAQEEFGEERLLAAVLERRDLPPPQLLAAATGRLQEFSRQEQRDDITLIVAQCR